MTNREQAQWDEMVREMKAVTEAVTKMNALLFGVGTAPGLVSELQVIKGKVDALTVWKIKFGAAAFGAGFAGAALGGKLGVLAGWLKTAL